MPSIASTEQRCPGSVFRPSGLSIACGHFCTAAYHAKFLSVTVSLDSISSSPHSTIRCCSLAQHMVCLLQHAARFQALQFPFLVSLLPLSWCQCLLTLEPSTQPTIG
jgi:hypothetical protein